MDIYSRYSQNCYLNFVGLMKSLDYSIILLHKALLSAAFDSTNNSEKTIQSVKLLQNNL